MLVLHRQREGEMDFELLALGLLVAAAATGIAWLHFGLKTPPCPFHSFTGLPCPTCGGTRCVENLLSGNLRAAFGWNPLVFVATAGCALFVFYAAAVTALRLPRIRPGLFSPTEAQGLRIVIATAIAANWIYLVFRFSHAA